jgi:hypothetical protein
MRFEEAQDVWLQPQEANVSSVISPTAAIVLLPAADFWPTWRASKLDKNQANLTAFSKNQT